MKRETTWSGRLTFPMIAVVLAIAVLGAACGSSDDGASEEGNSEAEPGETEFDLNATLTVTVNGPPSELDPHLEPHTGAQMYWTPLYDTLTDAFSAATPQPNVATEWERSDDGLSWVFTLREDVAFHDGTPLDAAAVKASIERAMTHPDSTVAGDLGLITAVEASGQYEVTITTSVFDPTLPTVLGGPAGAILNPVAIEAGNDFSRTPDGSGPYVLTDRVPEERASYERAPGTYWHPDAGRLAGFQMVFVDDFQSAINGIRAGQYDVAWLLGSTALAEQAVAADSDLQIIEYPPSSVQALYLNINEPALADVRVRQAISYAIDREALADALFDGGKDCSATSQNVPLASDPLHIEGYDPYPFDLAKARSLIEDAGAVGEPLTFHDIGATQSIEIAQAIQPMINEAGLNISIQNNTAEVTQQFRRNEVDGIVVTNVAQAHPLLTLSRYWMPDGAYHAAAGQHEGLQALIDQVNDPATTEEELGEIYDDMSEELARLSVIIPICAARAQVLADGDVVGLLEGQDTRINMRFAAVRNG